MRANTRLLLPCVLALFCAVPALPVRAEAIRWQTDLAAAQRQAAQTNRLVLVHFWATWCPPCLRMEREVFNQPELSATLSQHYVLCKLNKDEHEDIAQKLGVAPIPADVILTPDGQVVDAFKGFRPATQYLTLMTQVAQRQQAGGAMLASQATPELARDGEVVEAPLAPPYGRQATTAWSQPVTEAARPAARPWAGAQEPAQEAPAQGWQAQPASGQPWGAAEEQPALPEAAPPADYVGSPLADARLAARPAQNPSGYRSGPPPLDFNAYGGEQQTLPAPQAPPAAQNPPLGLDGFCPVHLIETQTWVRGDKQYGAIHRGRTYLFSTPGCQQAFLKEPDRYSPVMSGDDAVLAMEEGRGLPGRREYGVFYENRVYLFASEFSRDKFERDPARYAAPRQ